MIESLLLAELRVRVFFELFRVTFDDPFEAGDGELIARLVTMVDWLTLGQLLQKSETRLRRHQVRHCSIGGGSVDSEIIPSQQVLRPGAAEFLRGSSNAVLTGPQLPPVVLARCNVSCTRVVAKLLVENNLLGRL
jgi:hypothetical protein